MDPNVLFYSLIVPGLKIALVMAVLPLAVAGFTLAERKVIAFIQVRLGPMRVGPRGALQPIADVVKLFLKEDIIPAGANRILFTLAPIIAIVPAFLAVVVLPFGPAFPAGWADSALFSWNLGLVAKLVGADVQRPLTMSIVDLDIGLLFILAISSLGVFSILLAGWASNSKYPLLGGLRSAAQMISYEVPLGFGLIAALLMTRTLSMQGIIDAQLHLGMSLWILQPISLFLYFAAGVAETNRVPFDLPEAETELVSGFHTEYSGMKFAFFFLAEYINMVTVAALATTVFLGGWLPPFHSFLTYQVEAGVRVPYAATAFLFTPLCGFLFFVGKIAFFYWMYFWLRATLPRYRYDQLMNLGWKVLIPISMLNVLLVGLGVVFGVQGGWGRFMYFLWMLASVLVTLGCYHYFRSKRESHGKIAVGAH